MSKHDALLSAIVANPDDDLPRLVFADWLEENGEPERAEFIRVECLHARTDRESPDYLPLLRRSSRLLTAHSDRWFGEIQNEQLAQVVITERGFVDRIVIVADRFAAHGDFIRGQAPLLKELHIRAAGDWREFFHSANLAGLRALSFEDGVFTSEAAAALASSRHVWSLVELDLNRQPLGLYGAVEIASARLPQLEKLSVGECGLGHDGVQALLEGPYQNLRELDLSENGLTDSACESITAAGQFSRIERLALCENHITGAGISALASSPHLDQLQSLNLYLNPIGPAGGRAIAASRYWGKLKELNVIGCGVGVAAANELRWVYGDKAIKV